MSAMPPGGFDPRWKHQMRVTVLDQGLPVLPDVLDCTMSLPVAYWAAEGVRRSGVLGVPPRRRAAAGGGADDACPARLGIWPDEEPA